MFRSKSQFEKVLDKATSNMLLEPDFDSMLQLCDMIRSGDIKAREAVALMKTRVMEDKNPHVQFFSLCVLDTAMKNCGDAVHEEIITQAYLEELKDLVKTTNAENVKKKLLEMIQAWGIAFKDKSEYKIATNLYNIMKTEGYEFQAAMDTADMFKSEKAPVWKDGDECFKCKTEFGLVQRKHHCRACGGIFCNRCTSKQSIIPKYGIEKEVRVCDACYEENNPKTGRSKSSDPNALPVEYLNSSLAKESQVATPRSEQSLKEEEELQIALAMSLDEQQNRDQVRREMVYSSVKKVEPQQQQEIKATTNEADLDPELARYLNRNYWEKKKDSQEKQQFDPNSNGKKDTAAPESKQVNSETNVVTEAPTGNTDPPKEEESLQNGEVIDNEEFLHNLRTSVEIFMNRMRSDQMRNRSIANDSAVQSLFQSINVMHPMLLQFMNEHEEKRLNYEALQDKLTQIRDARAALDALREEHKEKLRRVAEEAERLRQIHMAQKLQIMRQKKQEYLAYQRQIALQRMQEQEAARQARLEQHKQFIMQRAMQPAMYVQGYNTQYMPAQPNIGDTAPDIQQATGMSSANYQQYAASYQPPGSHPPSNVIGPAGSMQPPYTQTVGMVNSPSQYTAQQMPVNTNYQQYQPVAPDTIQPGQPNMQMQGAPSQDSYNMAAMNTALPQHTISNIPGQPQVVATAPPPTPQPTPNRQQMSGGHQQMAGQTHMPQMGSAQQQAQQYYQPPQDSNQPQSQVPPPTVQPPTVAGNLLISFD